MQYLQNYLHLGLEWPTHAEFIAQVNTLLARVVGYFPSDLLLIIAGYVGPEIKWMKEGVVLMTTTIDAIKPYSDEYYDVLSTTNNSQRIRILYTCTNGNNRVDMLSDGTWHSYINGLWNMPELSCGCDSNNHDCFWTMCRTPKRSVPNLPLDAQVFDRPDNLILLKHDEPQIRGIVSIHKDIV